SPCPISRQIVGPRISPSPSRVRRRRTQPSLPTDPAISSVTVAMLSSTHLSRSNSCSMANRECWGNAAVLSSRQWIAASPLPNRPPPNSLGKPYRASRLRINPRRSLSFHWVPTPPTRSRCATVWLDLLRLPCRFYWGLPSCAWRPANAPDGVPTRLLHRNQYPVTMSGVSPVIGVPAALLLRRRSNPSMP